MADLTTAEIIAKLHERFPMHQGQWASIAEIMHIDFLAVGTWPSTHYVVHGFEVKASRSDWLRELKDPKKSERGIAMVDHWWLCAPAGVLKPGELPEGWGFMEATPRGTRIITQAPVLREPLPKKYVGKAYSRVHAEREAFSKLARNLVYARADRDALAGLETFVDTRPALSMAALATGRYTPGQREIQAQRRKPSPSRARRKARWERSQEVGW